MFGFGNAGKSRGGWFARQRHSAPVAVDFGRSSVRLLQLGAAGVSYRCLAAAEIPVQRGDAIVRAGERTLVLVETTDEWPVGRVPEQTRGASLQTLYLDGAERLSRGAGRPGSPGPRPIAMRAPPPAPAPRTSARSTPAR